MHCEIKVTPSKVIIDSSYNAEFVELLKCIPHSEREWDPEAKTWTVNLKHMRYVQGIAQQCYPNVWEVAPEGVKNLHTGERINSLFEG